MNCRKNKRGHVEYFVEEKHLKLKDLKEKARDLENQYLLKENIPASPRPEFHVSHLKHDTDSNGLCGIRTDNGFKDPDEDSEVALLWWSLVVGPDEIASAERRLLETTYPDRTEEQAQMQQSFLEKFTTSPAFISASRLGPYRFTFPLQEMLKAYSDQFCSGAQPIMRIFETVLYKQGVMHVVLVHSPANQEQFFKYPLLTDDPNSVCAYKDGCFIWRPEAMSETHRYELVLRSDEMRMEAQAVTSAPQYYVWDHVTVALHVDQQVLNFDAERLRENIKFCEKGYPTITRPSKFVDFPQAQKLVKELWPDCLSPLEKA